MSEYQTFTKQQQELKGQAASEQDPAKKRMIEMRREIEAHDYMAITHERLAGISRAITRGDNDTAQKDDRDASRHRARSMELRAERDGRANDNEKPRQQDRQQEPQRQQADGNAAPQTETATGRAPITNIQHTGNKGHMATKAERIEEARKLYFASMGEAMPDAKDQQRDTGRDAQRDTGRDTQNNPEREIIARQAEETKQREGLQTDQPAETARASTKEGRDIASKEEARAAYDAAMRGDSAASFREAGQEATRPTGRGGGKGR